MEQLYNLLISYEPVYVFSSSPDTVSVLGNRRKVKNLALYLPPPAAAACILFKEQRIFQGGS
jgi:hypothetical protein